jgi:hypothetical protein
MNPPITAAVIAAAVSVLGWVLNHILSSRSERKRARLTARLGHIERQLSELYGPLAFLIHEGRATFTDLLQNLGRTYIFQGDEPLPADELNLWLFWVDHELMPRNEKIQTILSANAHLIAGDELPTSYVRFLDHYNSWRMTHERWKAEGIAYSWHSKINWPTDFEDEILTTFRRLMRTHSDLVGAVS